MLQLAWDLFLSCTFRAVFTIATCAGVNILAWVYQGWQTGYFEEDVHGLRLWLVLGGVLSLVGLLGIFRKGGTEPDFSMLELFGRLTGPVYVRHPGEPGRRTLRRFPVLESCLLGGILVFAWGAAALWKEENLILRYCAIVGGVQIAWGLVIARSNRANHRRPDSTECSSSGPNTAC